MYRLLRLFFGPIMFVIYYLNTYFSYRHYPCGQMLTQAFTTVGVLWIGVSLVTLVILAFITLGKDGNKRFGIGRTIMSGLSLLFFTRLTAGIWIFMDKQERDLASGLVNFILGFVSFFTLCMVLVSFTFIVNALIKEEKKKK